jgi:hypothetical protein
MSCPSYPPKQVTPLSKRHHFADDQREQKIVDKLPIDLPIAPNEILMLLEAIGSEWETTI